MNNQSSIKSISTPPAVLDARLLDGSVSDRRCFVDSLREVCRDVGVFYLANHSVPAVLCSHVLQQAEAFFALPLEEKLLIDISRSDHFRGYSQMTNERDWREQVHFGLERPAFAGDPYEPAYRQLQGPNLWPERLGAEWQTTMLSFLSEIDALSRRLLSAFAAALELPQEYFDQMAGDAPYLLMKLICYYPQLPNRPTRSGVAPHCDWSWLTFLLQSEAGLEVETRNGEWLEVPPINDTLVVNLGELMEILTSGYFWATPHRVRNHSQEKQRVSVPVFINPCLDAVVSSLRPAPEKNLRSESAYHIHRVVDPDKPVSPCVFGDSEWQRKGLGRWCYVFNHKDTEDRKSD